MLFLGTYGSVNKHDMPAELWSNKVRVNWEHAVLPLCFDETQ
jgi:hypothetical protein